MKVTILDPGGLFKDYELHKVNPVSCEIDDVDAISRNFCPTKFVMEVTKYSGEKYLPRTVYGILCGLKRHLGDKNGDEGLNPIELEPFPRSTYKSRSSSPLSYSLPSL